MTINEAFCQCLSQLKLKNRGDIDTHIRGITRKLNQCYFDSDSETDHCLLVGSMGRKTSIDKESDIDILFELPRDVFLRYENREGNGPSQLLSDVRECLQEKYSRTDISGDGQVVDVFFSDYTVEVVPCSREKDESFTYPDSNDGGGWLTTNPLPEIAECEKMDSTFYVFRDFCKLIRAWRGENDVKCCGLLIDTLVYNFFQHNPKYKGISREAFDFEKVFPELLEWFKNQDKYQRYWVALGSKQYIWNKGEFNFVSKAKKACRMLEDSVDDKDAKWAAFQAILGDAFPDCPDEKSEGNSEEEFIDRKFPVRLTNRLKIDCNVTENGFKPFSLSSFFADSGSRRFLKFKKSLCFFIKFTDVEEPYDIYWKVRNVGKAAIRKKQIRGQINKGSKSIDEHTSFNGPHYVECYIVKNGVCVARDRIYVPINNDSLF